MHALAAAALSLVLGRDPTYIGPNGFDPSSMVIRGGPEGLAAIMESSDFSTWLRCDDNKECHRRRLLAVGYFVACAFDRDTTIVVKPHSWQGELGLAPGLKALARRVTQKEGSTAPLFMDPEEGKWVSACLMAFANMGGSHEYVWLRGSPPGWSSDLPAVLRWTMGYPEGVFFADLLGFNVAAVRGRLARREDRRVPAATDLERSYTLSLDLPRGYQALDHDGWAPPNASNGRALDYDRVTSAEAPPLGTFRVAENLGPYQAVHERLARSPKPSDADYPFDSICVGPGRTVVPCGAEGAVRLRPLFAHAPRAVSLASAGNTLDQSSPIITVSSGTRHLDDAQRASCIAGIACTGPFRLHAVGETPAWPSDMNSRQLVGLAEGQAIQAVLRFDHHREGYQLPVQDLRQPFTAIIRYRSQGPARAAVDVSAADGQWRATLPQWTDTRSEWEWLQVYPVYAFLEGSHRGQQPVLKVRISGVGDGKQAPTLDLAAFVPGEPWCLPPGQPLFADRCVVGHGERKGDLLTNRLPIRSPTGLVSVSVVPPTPGK